MVLSEINLFNDITHVRLAGKKREIQIRPEKPKGLIQLFSLTGSLSKKAERTLCHARG